MNIPDEVVETAAEALVSSTLGDRAGIKWEEFFEAARKALDAAAPRLVAQALRDAADALDNQPPKLKHQTVATLRLYADEPWRLSPNRKDAK